MNTYVRHIMLPENTPYLDEEVFDAWDILRLLKRGEIVKVETIRETLQGDEYITHVYKMLP